MALAAGWWRWQDALARWVTDVVRAEAGTLRPGLPPLAGLGACWPPELPLGAGGLELDSLERMQLAAAMSEALHMHRSGVADLLLARTTIGEWVGTAAASLDRYSERLTFRSSGSSGAPKAAVHAVADLEDEAGGHAALLGGDIRRVYAAVPCHHIYGFIFSILLPRQVDADSIDVRARSPAAVALVAEPGDVIVGHPDFWSAVLRSVAPTGAQGFRPGVTGVSSTAPLADDTARGLAAAGLSRLLQVHGSSETAGLGVREAPEEPYTLLPAWQRTEDGGLARTSAAAASIIPPDKLDWVDARRYHLAGRRDGVVQVAGLNVWPRRVESVLCQHPGVAAAAVRLMRPSEGTRLKAFIVPRDPAGDPAALRAELQDFATQLPFHEQPRAYTIGPVLPRTAMGKLAEWPVGAAGA